MQCITTEPHTPQCCVVTTEPYVFHSEHTKMKQNQIRKSPKAAAPTPNKANRTRFRPHNADRNAHRGCKNSGIYNRFAFAIKNAVFIGGWGPH